MDIFYLPHSFGGFTCVYVYMRSWPLVSVALQRHWVVPFVASASSLFTAFFCLSVSYLIELAQKQSKYRYLRLRVKPYWCPAEVSPLSVSVRISPMILSRVSMSCTSKDILHNDAPLFSQDCMAVETPLLHKHTLARFQTGVLTDKWYRHGKANRNKIECRFSFFVLVSSLPPPAGHSVVLLPHCFTSYILHPSVHWWLNFYRRTWRKPTQAQEEQAGFKPGIFLPWGDSANH